MRLRFTIYFLIDNNIPTLYSLSRRQIEQWSKQKKCKYDYLFINKKYGKV